MLLINDRWVFTHLILDKKATNLPRTSDSFSWFNICFPVLTLCPTICFFPVYLCLSSVARCQGKVPHRDSKSPLRSSAGLAPRQVCPCPQYQILSNILDAVGGSRAQPELGRNSHTQQLWERRQRRPTDQPRLQIHLSGKGLRWRSLRGNQWKANQKNEET